MLRALRLEGLIPCVPCSPGDPLDSPPDAASASARGGNSPAGLQAMFQYELDFYKVAASLSLCPSSSLLKVILLVAANIIAARMH